jgi:peptide/nickel transport system permease protein
MDKPLTGEPGAWRRLWGSSLAVRLSIVIFAIIVLTGLMAPLIAPTDPLKQDLGNILAAPSAGHWLGTDDVGRDNLTRLIYGTQQSLYAVAVALVIALALGLPLGILAGSLGGIVDRVIMRVVDSLLSLPAIVLAIAISGVMGAGLRNAMIAMGITFAPRVARLIRAQIQVVRHSQYVEAAVVAGCRRFEIIRDHLIPNSLQPLLVEICLIVAFALLAEAGLSFLGIGVQPPTPSWGNMLARSYTVVSQAGWQMFIPGLAITLAVLSVNYIGDGLREAFDPKRRSRA